MQFILFYFILSLATTTTTKIVYSVCVASGGWDVLLSMALHTHMHLCVNYFRNIFVNTHVWAYRVHSISHLSHFRHVVVLLISIFMSCFVFICVSSTGMMPHYITMLFSLFRNNRIGRQAKEAKDEENGNCVLKSQFFLHLWTGHHSDDDFLLFPPGTRVFTEKIFQNRLKRHSICITHHSRI